MDVLIIFRWIFNKNGLLIQELDSSALAQGTGVCHCEYGNALSDSIEQWNTVISWAAVVFSRRTLVYCDRWLASYDQNL